MPQTATRRKIGAITIGQSPRTDIVPEMIAVLGPCVEIIESGALDGLSGAEVAALTPCANDGALVTRLRDGTSVHVAEHHIVPRVQAQVDHLVAAGVELVALLCTGEFPAFRSTRLVVEPQVVLHHFVAGIGVRRLGVVVPLPQQTTPAVERWRPVATEVRVEAGSPYADIGQLEQAAGALQGWGADAIVLDCMGFTAAMKVRAAAIVGVPVILPRTVLARTLAELL